MESDSADGGKDDRFEQLERRITTLEIGASAALAVGADSAGTDEFWALQELQRRMPPAGAVLFTGDVTLESGENWSWQEAFSADSIMDSDWGTASSGLSALHHPVRLALLQAVIRGTTTAAGLTALDGFGTTGQVYHHLRALVAAGWLTSGRRGHYSVPGQRVVPLMVIIAAAQG